MQIFTLGAGGIGSFFAQTLSNLEKAKQFPDKTDIQFFDPDIVEEKNITYQNFEAEDIGLDKVEAIDYRLGFPGHCKRVTAKDMEGFSPDILVCAVDNAATRQAVFDHWLNTGTYFIDLRAEGRTISFFTPGSAVGAATPDERRDRYDKLSATLASASDEDGSCQRPSDMAAGIIQLGNQIIGPIGAQLVINRIRGIANPGSFIKRF